MLKIPMMTADGSMLAAGLKKVYLDKWPVRPARDDRRMVVHGKRVQGRVTLLVAAPV